MAFIGDLGFGLLLVLPALKMTATAGCLASGAAGAAHADFVLRSDFGWAAGLDLAGDRAGVPIGSFAIVGAAAFLSATTLGPLSSVVLVLELTRTADGLMVPMILATVGALWVVRRFEVTSIYSG